MEGLYNSSDTGKPGVKKMKIIKNEKGIALVMVLVMSAIALAIMAQLIYFVTQGTKISGMEKRYKTALEASIGGADVAGETIGLTSVSGKRGDFNTINDYIVALFDSGTYDTPVTCTPVALGVNPVCDALEEYDPVAPNYIHLETKLNLPTDCWSAACDTSLTIDPGDNTTYDLSFQLGTVPNVYNVYANIVDSTYGNSGAPTGLVKTGVVLSNKGEITVPQISYLYTVEVLSEADANPRERAKTSVLYAY